MQGAALGMLLMVLTTGSSRQFSQFESCAATFQFNKLNVSKCDVSQQITVVDGRYMLDIVVGERVEFII